MHCNKQRLYSIVRAASSIGDAEAARRDRLE
jgi:hypothetical protein